MSKIIELTKLNQVKLRAMVMQALQDIVKDPDFGFELRENVKRRLRAVKRAKNLISFDEIKKRHL